MDEEEAGGCVWNWAWEYILKQHSQLNHKTLNSLILALPLPTNNPDLPKFILLKQLQSRKSYLETDLQLLELIHEIDTQRGLDTASDAIKRAYCAVAVQSTVNHLTKPDGEFLFFESVKRVWRTRIARMKLELGGNGLGSEELWDWMDQLEAAVWDTSALDSVLDKSKSVNAVETVGIYLKQEMENVGTSFLESLRDRVVGDDVMKQMAGLFAENGRSAGPVGSDRKKIQRRNRIVKRSRGAKITDCGEDAVGPSKGICNSAISAEASNARKNVEESSKQLREAVKDPLPEVLRLAEEGRSGFKKGRGKEQDSVIVVDDDDMVQEPVSRVPEVAAKKQSGRAQTSRTDLANSKGCSPRKKIQSLSKDEIENLKNRREARKWSTEEEDTLRAGVREYGKGNWKLILTIYGDVFVDRTYVDLKDKWRNMVRYLPS